SGSYDFGEWETNQVAEQLTAEGRIRDAIAIYELNSEFYPESVSRWLMSDAGYRMRDDLSLGHSRKINVLFQSPYLYKQNGKYFPCAIFRIRGESLIEHFLFDSELHLHPCHGRHCTPRSSGPVIPTGFFL
ncbi:MAG: hypothetical protein V3U27_21095, partial [Candidatus Tectomicrobia bacterium]